MGNTYGIVKPGLTREGVVEALQSVLDSHFPGVFTLKSDRVDGDIALLIEGKYSFVLHPWDYEPGLWGGNSLDVGCYCADFSWWVMWVILHNLAVELGALVDTSEGSVPPYPERFSSFPEWLQKGRMPEKRLDFALAEKSNVPAALQPYMTGENT